MKQNNYKPKLGQHFLVDENVKNLIINSLKETKFKNILEIGPGEGSITNKLIDISNNYVGIEYDSTLYKKLSNRYEKNKNVNFLNYDAGIFDVLKLKNFFREDYILVGNLPYYSSNKIVRNFISSSFKPLNLVIMIQKEVADNYLLSTPKMKFVTNCVQMYAEPKLIANVNPESFNPAPKVYSSILNLKIKDSSLIPKNSELIIDTIKKGFEFPRKKITNSFVSFDKNKIINILNKLGINIDFRPGNLTLNNWEDIHKEINNEN
tara:strand:- start:370 stop:1161 length:792 start_codon:yes stop_codon:yes gene_type:complete